MHRHIIYIVNEKAGTRAKQNLIAFIEKKTTDRGIPFDLVSSVASGDYSFLDFIIKAERTTDIVIAGGDGTVNQVVNSLRRYKLRFGILPCGSGNGLALSAGIPRKMSAAIDIIFEGKARSIDAFTINGHFSCMLSGLGFDAQVAHDFSLQPTRGLSSYVKQVIRNFVSARAYPFQLQSPGFDVDLDAYFICIANSNQFGNNFTIAPAASLDDGLLDIVILARQNKLFFLARTLWQVLGRNRVQKGEIEFRKKGVIYFQTEKLRVHNPGGAPLHIDGEPYPAAQEYDIVIEKNSFQLLRPASS